MIIDHHLVFLKQVARYCHTELVIGNLVSGPGIGRQKTAADFMLALSTGFEQCEPVLNAILDTLIIAGFKVQAVVVFQAAPVSSIEGIVATQHDCAGKDTCGVLHRGAIRKRGTSSKSHTPIWTHNYRNYWYDYDVVINFHIERNDAHGKFS